MKDYFWISRNEMEEIDDDFFVMRGNQGDIDYKDQELMEVLFIKLWR